MCDPDPGSGTRQQVNRKILGVDGMAKAMWLLPTMMCAAAGPALAQP
ncbi:MAG: hypothetical protein JWM38_1909, partial [Sphingomonas bacterium]|nr:hypothetical protein [Sphingomonas bacterium]